MLFGANSAGKSTLLHALHYAREVIENNNPDADETLCGGSNLRLGGFRNFVHGHSLNRDVKLHFEITPDSDGVPNFGQILPQLDLNNDPVWGRWDVSTQMKRVVVSLTIRWDQKRKLPWVYEYAVTLNDYVPQT